MITAETFTQEWINSFKKTKEYSRINPPVFEKMIFAFGLLEKLAETGIDFIFKGGTSLILLLENFHRFSTDVDIITCSSDTELESALSKVIGSSVFTKFELDSVRSKTGIIPKAHYLIKYNSAFHSDAHVVLDVLFEENPYSHTLDSEINAKWLKITNPIVKVKTPDINSILGDKITAFAPNTIGVPYFRNGNEMNTEIIKQLFDVGMLINQASNIEFVYQSFLKICFNQFRYRNMEISYDIVYQDIFNTAFIIAKRDRNIDFDDRKKFLGLQNGISSFNAFLSNGSFRIDDAIVASAKIAWLTTIFKTKKFDEFNLYNPKSNILNLEIRNLDYNFMNRFKRTNKEAFYYWFYLLNLRYLID